MFPTRTDLSFYQSKTTPKWVEMLDRFTSTNIDQVVNAHAGIRETDGERSAAALIFIMRRFHSQPEVLLEEVARYPQCAVNPEKRVAFARKWLAKIESTSRATV